MTATKLVIGASGFLGSHVTRQLVAAGEDVRVMLRPTSSTKGIDDLAVERCYGDVFDDAALRAAMAGCDVVYYCVVDARMWLRDPAQLFRTNVEGLAHVLDAAVSAGLRKSYIPAPQAHWRSAKPGRSPRMTARLGRRRRLHRGPQGR